MKHFKGSITFKIFFSLKKRQEPFERKDVTQTRLNAIRESAILPLQDNCPKTSPSLTTRLTISSTSSTLVTRNESDVRIVRQEPKTEIETFVIYSSIIRSEQQKTTIIKEFVVLLHKVECCKSPHSKNKPKCLSHTTFF